MASVLSSVHPGAEGVMAASAALAAALPTVSGMPSALRLLELAGDVCVCVTETCTKEAQQRVLGGSRGEISFLCFN